MSATSPSPLYQPGALYFVRSDRNPNLFYTVGHVEGRCACGQRIVGLLHCQCQDHILRAHDCKHVRRVVAGQVRPAMVKAAIGKSFQFDDGDLFGDGGAAVARSVASVRQAVAS